MNFASLKWLFKKRTAKGRAIEVLVKNDIKNDITQLIHTLSAASEIDMDLSSEPAQKLARLIEQASELARPVLDDEEIIVQAAWMGTSVDDVPSTVHEHWIVSPWLGRVLDDQGEKVELNFAGLSVWARTMTGQPIEADEVFERVYAKTR